MSANPTGWESAALGDVCVLNPKHGREIHDSTNVSFVPMAAVDEEAGTIIHERTEQRRFGDVRRGYTHFAEGDVIFAKITPCMQNGKSAVAHGLVSGLACGSTEFFVLRPKDGMDSSYVHAYLRQKTFRDDARAAMTGVVGQARVPREYLEACDLPLPPLAEQRRIVAMIEALMAKSRRAKRALDAIPPLLERFRQSVLAAAFRGDLTADWRAQHPDVEPADQLLARIRRERRTHWEETELAKMRAKGKEPIDGRWTVTYKEPVSIDTKGLPELPRGWGWTTLELLTKFITSGSRGWGGHYSESGPLFIRSQDISTDTLSINAAARVQLPDKSETARTRVMADDLLITITGANVTRAARVHLPLEEAYVSQHVALVRLVDPSSALLLHLWLMDEGGGRGILKRSAYGGGKPGLNLDNLRRLAVPVIPRHEADQLLLMCGTALSRIQRLEEARVMAETSCGDLDESILAKAFRGELVPQDPNDEPASVLLERIRAKQNAAFLYPRERATDSFRRGARNKKTRTHTSSADEQPSMINSDHKTGEAHGAGTGALLAEEK